jgi:hypothetical protein
MNLFWSNPYTYLTISFIIIYAIGTYIGFNQFFSGTPIPSKSVWFILLFMFGVLLLVYNIYTVIQDYSFMSGKQKRPISFIEHLFKLNESLPFIFRVLGLLSWLLPIIYIYLGYNQYYSMLPISNKSMWFLVLFLISLFVFISMMYSVIIMFHALNNLPNMPNSQQMN